MSIYIMTVGDLAKKRGESVGEFVKKVQSLGFEAGSHAKKLTQSDLDFLIPLLDGTSKSELVQKESKNLFQLVHNPNVLLINLPNGKRNVIVVDASIKDTGDIDLRIVNQSTEDSVGEALLEFRKQMGIYMGIN